jgi:glycosyltransferase involved in cell wall biosynthesis
MAQPYLSIIIPAYNEAERIPATLVDMDRRLSGVDYSYEILVVNDGSKDNTAIVVKNMAKMVKNLKLIDFKENVGKGGAVKQGMVLAAGRVRLFTDADNSTSIDQFEKMIPLFKEGYGVVIGSRALKGAQLDPPEPFYRQAIGKVLNFLVQLFLLPGIWDTQCGFKAYTDEAAEKIFTISKTVGWGFDVESLTLARRLGFRIKEIPVHWVNDTRSHVKFSGGLQFLAETSIIRWRLWTDGYHLKR